jgi:hypothetical protein
MGARVVSGVLSARGEVVARSVALALDHAPVGHASIQIVPSVAAHCQPEYRPQQRKLRGLRAGRLVHAGVLERGHEAVRPPPASTT